LDERHNKKLPMNQFLQYIQQHTIWQQTFFIVNYFHVSHYTLNLISILSGDYLMSQGEYVKFQEKCDICQKSYKQQIPLRNTHYKQKTKLRWPSMGFLLVGIVLDFST
jgi:hypothetical protein